jgi:hypothetical protein
MFSELRKSKRSIRSSVGNSLKPIDVTPLPRDVIAHHTQYHVARNKQDLFLHRQLISFKSF